MTEFEKWLDSQKSEVDDANRIAIEDKMAKKTWKAALEWVLERESRILSGAEILIGEIEEELDKLTSTQSQNQSNNQPPNNPD